MLHNLQTKLRYLALILVFGQTFPKQMSICQLPLDIGHAAQPTNKNYGI